MLGAGLWASRKQRCTVQLTRRPIRGALEGCLSSYRVFRKDQRVSHTSIVESKRPEHALSLVKAQGLKRETKVLTNSETTD